MKRRRTSIPTTWNELYNNYQNGGLSNCIKGCPVHPIANVLANCVGYACARFNEIYNEEAGKRGMTFPQLCCNAEEFWFVADRIGLKKGPVPKPGAIMCWEGLGNAAGHVAIVERVNNQNQVYTSESGYGGPFFWNAVRYRGDGNWGTGAGYKFLGFIYNPGVRNYEWKKEWHLYEDGKELTGWAKVDGKWYYLNVYGAMQTGWLSYNGKWYHLDSSGAMDTGWKKILDRWYYLQPVGTDKYKEGEMRTGWLKDKDKWYLLSNNGDMLTGWQKVNNKWYYLQPVGTNEFKEGEMRTGWLKDKDKWYYLDPTNGDMKTGWLDYNGKTYYLESNGAMVTGTKVIDGKTYTFDDSGALIK